MPSHRIANVEDPRLEIFRHLKATNRTRDLGLFVVEGATLLERLCRSRFEIVSMLVSQRFEPRLVDYELPPEVEIYVAPHEMVEQVVGFNFHRGVISCGRRRPNLSLEQLAEPPWNPEAGPSRGPQRTTARSESTLIACPNLANPENLGALLRLAAGFGADGVLVGQPGPDPWSRRVLRVSMGAALTIPIRITDDPVEDLLALRQHHGYQTLATVLDPKAEPLEYTRRPERICLIFGHEAHGLAPEHIEAAQRRITIPMDPGFDSLNIAVAAGIILHHFTRQHAFEPTKNDEPRTNEEPTASSPPPSND